MSREDLQSDWRQRWKSSGFYIILLTAMLWSIETINATVDHQLNILGIYPRTLDGLYGIPLWPLLHGNMLHLLVNTTPFLVLGWFVGISGMAVFVRTTLLIVVVGGLGVWLFGRPSYHVGASGLVFGYFGFLVARAFYERSLSALVVATLTLFYYGGMIVGIVPTGELISWESHLFGLLAGVYAARTINYGKTDSK